jgi:flagellar hook-length control protein FliK
MGAVRDVQPKSVGGAKATSHGISVQDVNPAVAPSSGGQNTGPGTGGNGTNSGRKDPSPGFEAKPQAPQSWPAAFALRVPEAFTSSLDRTGSVAQTLPPSAPQAEFATVGPQLVRGVQFQVNAGGGELKLTLSPEHLGKVTIEVLVNHDRVSATMTAETPQVRQWIAAHQDDLKASLASLGLSLDDLTVKDEGGGGQNGREAEEQPQSGRRRRGPEKTEAQFEVLV